MPSHRTCSWRTAFVIWIEGFIFSGYNIRYRSMIPHTYIHRTVVFTCLKLSYRFCPHYNDIGRRESTHSSKDCPKAYTKLVICYVPLPIGIRKNFNILLRIESNCWHLRNKFTLNEPGQLKSGEALFAKSNLAWLVSLMEMWRLVALLMTYSTLHILKRASTHCITQTIGVCDEVVGEHCQPQVFRPFWAGIECDCECLTWSSRGWSIGWMAAKMGRRPNALFEQKCQELRDGERLLELGRQIGVEWLL